MFNSIEQSLLCLKIFKLYNFGKIFNEFVYFQDLIQKPILRTEDKGVKKDACEVFRHILFEELYKKGGTYQHNHF